MSVLLPNKPTRVTIDVGSSSNANTIVDDSGISIFDNNTSSTNITLKSN